eukprot:4178491-Alexandrium_andersonii.AAC.1
MRRGHPSTTLMDDHAALQLYKSRRRTPSPCIDNMLEGRAGRVYKDGVVEAEGECVFNIGRLCA